MPIKLYIWQLSQMYNVAFRELINWISSPIFTGEFTSVKGRIFSKPVVEVACNMRIDFSLVEI